MSDLTKRISDLSPAKRELLARLLKQKGMANSRLPIMPRHDSSDKLPLSYAQQRLWFLNQLEPGSTVYNVNTIIPLAPSLSASVIEKSLNEIVRRHESLRTVFRAVAGEPIQVIVPEFQLDLPMVDLSEMPEAESETEVMRLMREEAGRPFDLSTLPLLRTVLVRLSEEDQLLLLTMHHIVTDGLSVKIFTEELAALSEAFAAGRPTPLPALPIQYADFAVWQREWLQGAVMKEQLDYWKQQLSDLSALSLPTDLARPAVSSHLGADEPVKLSIELSEQVRELSRREGVTLFMTLLAAFGVLLSRYTRQDDIVVGTPVAGRDRVELEKLIGFFINTLVLRIDLSGNPSFRDLLGRVKETALGAYAHQDLPFEKLVEELHPERDLSRNPLFQVSFQLLPELDASDEADVPTRSAELEQGTAMFDLGLDVWESATGLKGSIEYSTELFHKATIERMADHYRNLLESIVADPERRVSELELLSADERRQILSEWNQTPFEYPRTLCLHQLFEQQVERTPDNVAVVFEQERLTYTDLNRRANQLAHYLKKLGVGPDQIIGICMERSHEVLVGLLGVLKAGCGYVALDPSHPRERLEFMLKDAGARVVLTQRRFAEELPGQIRHVISLDADWEVILGESAENPLSEATPENLAVIIYTSGSTGQPKGVMLPHRGLCNRLLWGKEEGPYGLTGEDRLLQMFSFSFDFSVWDIFTSLICGAQLILTRPGGSQDSSYLVKLMAEQGITIVGLTPSLLEVLLNEPGIENCRALKKISLGGEALSVELQERLFARLKTELHNTYGPTETSIDVTSWVCRRESNQRSVPIGHPNGNTQIYLLDEKLQPVPIGVAGELHVGGENLARGYLNQPALTAAKFIPNPFGAEPGARLYKTGDLARHRTDGEIEFVGRLDDQIKLRGFRIELGEIEAVLAGHTNVLEAAVITVDAGRGEKRLVAYLVPAQGHVLSVSELRAFAETRLPGYMVPAAFILLDALPRTPNGKVNRRALPVPERIQPELEKTFTPPRTQTEDLLARIWTEVLTLDRIGIYDNFFALGGHSLLATQVISRIRAAFQIEIPLRSIFETPTISDLAEAIERTLSLEGKIKAATSITRVPREQYRATLSAHGVPEVSAALRTRLSRENGNGSDASEVKAHFAEALDNGKP
jgi:amino acid adenylation domain-containing protein